MPKPTVTEEIGFAIARGLALIVSDLVLNCLPQERDAVENVQKKLLEQQKPKTKTKKPKTKTIDTKAKVINVED